MRKSILESLQLQEATKATDVATGVLEVEFITPGWGATGYYSAAVVEAAAPLFAVGTHMYFDHPTEAEDAARPVRSVRDLAAVIVEAGVLNKATGGVRGKVKPLKPYLDLLTDEAFTSNVGLSIRGSATDIVVGEAEGRTGPIIEGLADIKSVDFVTRAGRGGKILAVLESARAEVDLEEATASDRRDQLQSAVKAEYDRPNNYVWVRDLDADERIVYFSISSGDGPTQQWSQTFDVGANDVDITLTGNPTEVRAVTNYVPVNPAGQPTTQESEEISMAKIQIEESEHAALTEKAGRVPTLESERDTAIRERNEARASIPALTKARSLVTEANKDLPSATVDRIVNAATTVIPLTESGELDEPALTKAVETARTAEEAYLAGLAEAAGAGTISGFGAQSTAVTEASKPTTTPFGRPIKQEA